jgi:hypothetical protein
MAAQALYVPPYEGIFTVAKGLRKVSKTLITTEFTKLTEFMPSFKRFLWLFVGGRGRNEGGQLFEHSRPDLTISCSRKHHICRGAVGRMQ